MGRFASSTARYAPAGFAIALLAGCAGGAGSQVASSGVLPINASQTFGRALIAPQTADSFSQARWATYSRGINIPSTMTQSNSFPAVAKEPQPPPCTPRGYLSLNTSGTIRVFPRPLTGGPYIGPPIVHPAGAVYGWGVAMNPANTRLYVGTSADAIDVFTSCGVPLAGGAGAYTGNGLGAPLGLAADSSGCVHADEWNGNSFSNQIDRWCAPGPPGAGSGPDTNMAIPFYLAVGGSSLYVSGYGSISFFNDQIDKCPLNGPYSSCTTCWSIPGGFPGGLAVDAFGRLLASDGQNRRIYTFVLPCGSPPVNTFNYPPCRAYTGIALNPGLNNRLFVASATTNSCGGPNARTRTLVYTPGTGIVGPGLAAQVSPVVPGDGPVAIALH